MKWTNNWPDEEGFYWLFGYPWGKDDKKPELWVCKVFYAGNGYIVGTANTVLNPREVIGIWQYIPQPDVSSWQAIEDNFDETLRKKP